MLDKKPGSWLLGFAFAAAVPGCGAGEPADTMTIRNAAQPIEGVLTAGQPTRAELEAVASAGYKTVVNLRQLDEEGAWDETEFVEGLGMKFVHLPIAGGADINVDNALRLAELLDDPDAKPLMIHCASSNRVGALIAIKAAIVDGTSVDEALELGLSAGLSSLKKRTREVLE